MGALSRGGAAAKSSDTHTQESGYKPASSHQKDIHVAPLAIKVSDQISSIDFFFWSCAHRFRPSLRRQTGASANVKNEADLCQGADEAAGNPAIKRAPANQKEPRQLPFSPAEVGRA